MNTPLIIKSKNLSPKEKLVVLLLLNSYQKKITIKSVNVYISHISTSELIEDIKLTYKTVKKCLDSLINKRYIRKIDTSNICYIVDEPSVWLDGTSTITDEEIRNHFKPLTLESLYNPDKSYIIFGNQKECSNCLKKLADNYRINKKSLFAYNSVNTLIAKLLNSQKKGNTISRLKHDTEIVIINFNFPHNKALLDILWQIIDVREYSGLHSIILFDKENKDIENIKSIYGTRDTNIYVENFYQKADKITLS